MTISEADLHFYMFQIDCCYVAEYVRSLTGHRVRPSSVVATACRIVHRSEERLILMTDAKLMAALERVEPDIPECFLPRPQDVHVSTTEIKRTSPPPLHNLDNGAELDRIDYSQGYIKGNVITVSKSVFDLHDRADPAELAMICSYYWDYVLGDR